MQEAPGLRLRFRGKLSAAKPDDATVAKRARLPGLAHCPAIDGDTIRIGIPCVRLEGIDGPR
jgi:hypothetical protein